MNCFEITFSNFLNNLSHALYVIKINRRTLHEKEKNCRTFTIGTLFEILCTTQDRERSKVADFESKQSTFGSKSPMTWKVHDGPYV